MIHPAGSAPTTGATGAAAPDAGVATVWAAAAVAVLTVVLVACLHLGAAPAWITANPPPRGPRLHARSA